LFKNLKMPRVFGEGVVHVTQLTRSMYKRMTKPHETWISRQNSKVNVLHGHQYLRVGIGQERAVE
jgi:hypothetical protein